MASDKACLARAIPHPTPISSVAEFAMFASIEEASIDAKFRVAHIKEALCAKFGFPREFLSLSYNGEVLLVRCPSRRGRVLRCVVLSCRVWGGGGLFEFC